MQAVCGHCGAKYEFDAAAIPPEGYDAQCTTCNNVFFIKPEAPAEPEQVTVRCQQCGTSYEFAPTDIPEDGYDAQCTECQAVFFVSRDGKARPVPELVQPFASPAAVVAPSPVVAPTHVPASSTQASVASPDPVGVSAPTPAPAARPQPRPTSAEWAALRSHTDDPDLRVDANAVGEDFELIMRRKRRRLMIAGAAALAVPLLSALLYFVLPGVFDASVGKLVGIKARIHPDAIPLAEAGLVLMLKDTESAYGEAIGKFDAALAIDRLYPDAVAFKALAHSFRAADLQEQGKERREQGSKLVAQMHALKDGKKKRAEDPKLGETLHAEAKRLANEATKFYERGGEDFKAAQKEMEFGLEKMRGSPMVVAASGIVMILNDADRLPDAEKRLRISLKERGASEQLDPKNPPDAWLPFLQGLIERVKPGNAEAAAPFFAAAALKESRFQRALYEVANTWITANQPDKAREALNAIVAQVPEHEKAKLLQARLNGTGR